VARRIGKPSITVGIDGSTYRYHPFYHSWVREKITDLLENAIEVPHIRLNKKHVLQFNIVQAGDGSGKGAALIAAIASRLHEVEAARQQDEVSPTVEVNSSDS
jgi:hexokinase